MQKRKFRCKHCGDSFILSQEDQEMYDEGYMNGSPDECYDCVDMINHPQPDESYSDADPGL